MLDDIGAWGWEEAPPRRLVFAADVPRLGQPLPRALPPDADDAIMSAVAGLDDGFARIGLTVLRGAGLRVGELLDLEIGSIIDYGPAGTWLRVPLGKLATERMVPLDAATLAALDEWARQRGAHRPVPHPLTGELTDFLFTARGCRLGATRLRNGLAGFARSMPSLHQLLPDYACIHQPAGLTSITDVTLPELDTAMVADATRFYAALRDAETRRPASLEDTYPIIGVRQSTATTARLTAGTAELITSYHDEDLYGDATVPVVATCRADVPLDSNTLRRVPDKHGNLQRNTAALDEVEGILTAAHITIKAARPISLQVDAPELALRGENVTVHVTPSEPDRHALLLTLTSETGRLIDASCAPPPAP
jgi:hypothetical protein